MNQVAVQEPWAPENSIDHYKAIRARLMNGQKKAAPVPRLRVIDCHPPEPRRAATIYLKAIGPRWHTDMYDYPIGPRKIKAPGTPASARMILHEVADKHGITVEEMTNRRRLVHLVRARQEAIWRIHDEMRWSLPRIGHFLGGYDHTTILHAIRKHQTRVDAEDRRCGVRDN